MSTPISGSCSTKSSISPESIEQLNQKWQTIVSPKVFVEWGKNNSDDCAKKEKYKLGEMIAKIHTFHSEGKSICVFPGRTPYEKLPSDNNEAKENEVWIALDISIISSEGRNELIETPGIDQRIFLWIDYNQQEGLELIKGLFDKVVIDQSTTKAFSNDFAKRSAVLLRNSKSELIFEMPFLTSYGTDISVTETKFDTQNYGVIIPIKSLSKIGEGLTNIEKSKLRNKFLNETVSNCIGLHLKTLYNSVEEHKEKNYPYLTNYSYRKNTDHYFVVSDYRNPSGS